MPASGPASRQCHGRPCWQPGDRPTRRHLLDRLHADNGQTLSALCGDLTIRRQNITEHLIEKFERPDLEALSGLKKQLEQEARPMDKPKLVHVTYIATTPEQLWNALTDPELTAQYWGHRNVSGWTRGDPWEHRRPGEGIADLVGTPSSRSIRPAASSTPGP